MTYCDVSLSSARRSSAYDVAEVSIDGCLDEASDDGNGVEGAFGEVSSVSRLSSSWAKGRIWKRSPQQRKDKRTVCWRW